jgi:homoserine/homoserine lactone efflux protein
MDLHVWLTYFAAAWAIALSPGSGAVLSMTHGLAYGVRGDLCDECVQNITRKE